MFWLFVFIFVDFNLGLGEIQIDIFPDFLGWLWLAGAFVPLKSLAPMVPVMRKMALLLALFTLPTFIHLEPVRGGIHLDELWSLSHTNVWSWSLTQLSLVSTWLHAMLVWCLIGFMMKVTRGELFPQHNAMLRLVRNTYVWPMIVLPFWQQFTSMPVAAIAVLVIFYILWALLVSLLFLSSLRSVARYCEGQARSVEYVPPELIGKENSALENAMLGSQDEKRRYRFSLTNLILLMALIAMGSSQLRLIWNAQVRSARSTEAEELLKFYKDKLGRLNIRDKDKIYARAVPMPEQHQWEWRVHVPLSGLYRVHAIASQVPAEDIPSESSVSVRLEPGESIITAEFDKDAGDHGQLHLSAVWDDPSRSRHYVADWRGQRELTQVVKDEATYDLQANEVPYVVGSGGWNGYSQVAETESTEIDEDQPIVLERRVIDGRLSSTPAGPSQGIMIWIERVTD